MKRDMKQAQRWRKWSIIQFKVIIYRKTPLTNHNEVFQRDEWYNWVNWIKSSYSFWFMFISVFHSSAGIQILSYGRRSKSHPWILMSLSSFSPKRQSRRRRNLFRTQSAGRKPSRWAEMNLFGRRRSGWRGRGSSGVMSAAQDQA